MNLRAYPKKHSVPVVWEYIGWPDASDIFKEWVNDFMTFWRSEDSQFTLRLLSDKEQDRGAIASIGSHFSPESYKNIQKFINRDFEENEVYCAKKNEIIKRVNAMYGLEV
jgi:hypothetical protein